MTGPGAFWYGGAEGALLLGGTTDRRAVVTWAELEVPDAPRRAVVTFAEFEVPDAPRRAVVTFAEFEVPDEPRRAIVTWAELETPDAPRRAIVTWAEFETPDVAAAPVMESVGGTVRWRRKRPHEEPEPVVVRKTIRDPARPRRVRRVTIVRPGAVELGISDADIELIIAILEAE